MNFSNAQSAAAPPVPSPVPLKPVPPSPPSEPPSEPPAPPKPASSSPPLTKPPVAAIVAGGAGTARVAGGAGIAIVAGGAGTARVAGGAGIAIVAGSAGMARVGGGGGIARVVVLIAVLLISVGVSVLIGAHPLSFADIAQLFSNGSGSAGGGSNVAGSGIAGTDVETVSLLVYEIRLPRIAASASIGAALALAGAAFQSLFRNSLVSPGILGASSGAAFGAALAMLLSLPVVVVQATAFAGGLGAVLFAAVLGGGWRATPSPLRLVLTGMVVGQLCGSGVAIVKLLADTESKLPAITFWLMGGLSGMACGDLALLLPPLAVGAVVVLRLRWSLNLLALGEDEARALGAPVRTTRVLTLLGATLLASACVAVAGVVGWVGLMAPHAARCWVGPNNRDLLPVAALLGALFMLWADNAARSLASAEIPLGIVTSVVGAPVFLLMLHRLRRGWTRE